MIASLRKRHLLIWSAWIILIPIGIIASYISIKPQFQEEGYEEESTLLLLDSIDRLNYSVKIYSLNTDSMLVEWLTKKPLQSASAILYAQSSFSSRRSALGTVNVKKKTKYKITITDTLILRDVIRGEDI